MSTKENQPERIVSGRAIFSRIPVSYRTLQSWVEAGLFPAPRELNGRRRGWYEHEIDAWLSALPTRVEPATSLKRVGDQIFRVVVE